MYWPWWKYCGTHVETRKKTILYCMCETLQNLAFVQKVTQSERVSSLDNKSSKIKSGWANILHMSSSEIPMSMSSNVVSQINQRWIPTLTEILLASDSTLSFSSSRLISPEGLLMSLLRSIIDRLKESQQNRWRIVKQFEHAFIPT